MSNIHIGQLTSEVHASGGGSEAHAEPEETSPYEEAAQLAAQLARLQRLSLRTATGTAR